MKHTLSLTLDTLLDKKNGLRTVSVGFRLPLFLIKNPNETVCNRFQVGILAGGKHTDAVGFKWASLLIRNQRKHTHTRTVGVADPHPARHSSAFWSHENRKIYVWYSQQS